MRATRGRPWIVWLFAFSAFFTLGLAWSVALPVNGTYDENQHLVRAYAVVDGQLLPGGQGLDGAGLPAETFEAPRSLLPADVNCTWRPKPPKPASCQRAVSDQARAPMPSQAARYSPVYYALVGVPLKISPDFTGLVFARLLSTLWSAVLLATALVIAFRLRRPLLAAGVVLVATPMVLNLAGSVNPNSLEITAGVLLFVALLGVLRPEVAAPGGGMLRRVCVIAAGGSAVLLITVRPLGPVLFGCVAAACLMVADRIQSRRLIRSRLGWLGFAVPALLATGFAGWWMSYSAGEDLPEVTDGAQPSYGVVDILLRLPGTRGRFYLQQVVGQFGYGETTASPLLILAWYALLAAIVLPAVLLAGARLRVAVAGVLAVCLAILVYGELHFVPIFGWYSQSRYVAPLGVGAVLLAAASDQWADRLSARGRLELLSFVLVAATLPLHLYALIRVVSRFRVGITAGFSPFSGSWEPPLGALLPLLAAGIGAALLALLVGYAGGLRLPGRAAWQTESAGNDRRVGARKDVLG